MKFSHLANIFNFVSSENSSDLFLKQLNFLYLFHVLFSGGVFVCERVNFWSKIHAKIDRSNFNKPNWIARRWISIGPSFFPQAALAYSLLLILVVALSDGQAQTAPQHKIYAGITGTAQTFEFYMTL